jgi:hypothetical protein
MQAGSAAGRQAGAITKARRSASSLKSFDNEEMRHLYLAADATSELGVDTVALGDSGW